MKVIAIALVAFLIGSCQAQPDVSGSCILDPHSGTIHMYFYLSNNDPLSVLSPIDDIEYQKVPKNYSRVFDDCEITFNSSTGVYSFESVVDIFGSTVIENGCSVISTDEQFPRWRILYTTDDDSFIGGGDVLYILDCTPAVQLENVITTTITALTPNLNQDAIVTKPDVDFDILVDDGNGNFGAAATANAGDLIKLQLTLTREPDFNNGNNMFTQPFGVYGFKSFSGPRGPPPDIFDSNGRDLIIDNHGCPFDGTNNADPGSRKPKSTPSEGYMGRDTGIQYLSITGSFELVKYRSSDQFVVTTSFDIFYESRKDDFVNPCGYNTNVLGRKKRSDKPDYRVTLSTYITINSADLDDDKTEDKLTSRQLSVTIIAVAAVLFALVMAGLVCLMAFMMDRRRRQKQLEPFRSSSTASIVIREEK